MEVDELLERYGLCISSSAERRRQFEREFAREGLAVPRKIDGIYLPHVDGGRFYGSGFGRYSMVNCAAAHQMCIRVAKAFSWPCVAVFEDDAVPRKGAKERLAAALQAHQSGGVLFPGWCRFGASGVIGSHAYIMFADSYGLHEEAYRSAGALKTFEADTVFSYPPLLRRIARTRQLLFCQANSMPDGQICYISGERIATFHPPAGFKEVERG